MNCYIHPDREAVGTCTTCGKPICSECAVEMQNKLVCRSCLSAGRATPVSTAVRPLKDRSMAIILEILPGLFGFLGFGWMYSGRTDTGILLLVGFFVWDIISGVIAAFTAFIGLCCTLPISIGLVALSTYFLNTYIKQRSDLFGG